LELPRVEKLLWFWVKEKRINLIDNSPKYSKRRLARNLNKDAEALKEMPQKSNCKGNCKKYYGWLIQVKCSGLFCPSRQREGNYIFFKNACKKVGGFCN